MNAYINNFFKFSNSLLLSEPNLLVQLTILTLETAMMFPLLRYITMSWVRPIMKSLSKETQDRFVLYAQKSFKESFFVVLNYEEVFYAACLIWTTLIVHAIGGILCMSAIFRWPFPPRISGALARHGALFESAYEWHDTLKRGYQVLFTTGFKQMTTENKYPIDTMQRDISEDEEPDLNTLPVIILMTMHHFIGQMLILPMNIYYPEDPLYQEMVFLLMFAGFSLQSLTMIGYTIDTSTICGVLLMESLAIGSWLIVLYSRIYRYSQLVKAIATMLYQDQAYFILSLSVVGIILMTVLNLLILFDGSRKLIKFTIKLLKMLGERLAPSKTNKLE